MCACVAASPLPLTYLVLEVVLAQVSGLSGAAISVGQGALSGERRAVCDSGSSIPQHTWPSPCLRPGPLTRLSSRLATMEANLRSPASSEMRKTYSGAETWLDLWVRPEGRKALRDQDRGVPGKELPGLGQGPHQTAEWRGLRSRAAPGSCVPGAAGSGLCGRLGGRRQSWRPQR